MTITITATITDEQALTLAVGKGYAPTIPVISPEGERVEEVNTESAQEFLKRIYEGMIIHDATVIFKQQADRAEKEAKDIRNKEISDLVSSSITSSIS